MTALGKLKTLALGVAAAALLSACGGGSSVTSPGEGQFATGGTGGGGSGGGGGTGGASADCPTGFINLGTMGRCGPAACPA
jgi:hypothetical protein